jgi:two-component system, response regulator YesN
MGREMATMSKEYQEIWERDGLPKLSQSIDACHSLEQMREEYGGVMTDLAVKLQEAQDKRQHAAIVREMRKFIEEHYMNPDMSLEYLSDKFNISPKYVSKLFKDQTGHKFVDFLIDIRMQQAQRLLGERSNSVQEIADQVGYLNAISFSRVFRRVVGYSPSEYRDEAARRHAD